MRSMRLDGWEWLQDEVQGLVFRTAHLELHAQLVVGGGLGEHAVAPHRQYQYVVVHHGGGPVDGQPRALWLEPDPIAADEAACALQKVLHVLGVLRTQRAR